MSGLSIGHAIRVRSAARSSSIPLALPCLFLLGAGILAALSLFGSVPTTPDELVYIELARHLGASGRFEILGIPFPAWTYGPAYVGLIAPITKLAATAREAYVAIRVLNAFVFASAAFPAFLVGARALSRRSSVVVAAAAIAVPASVYTTKVMTESLAYPVALWCVVAALRVHERPSVQRQLVLVLAGAAAAAVRFELLALGPALAIGCLLQAEGRIQTRLRTMTALLVATGALIVGMFVLLHATSGAAAGAGTHGFNSHHFSVGAFGASLIGSIGATALYTGVIPFVCLFIVARGMLRRAHWVSGELRAVVTTTLAAGAALLLTSSAYIASLSGSDRPPVPVDRYLFYLAPLVFVVCGAWIEAGAIRDRGTARIAIGVAALPLLAALFNVGRGAQGTINAMAFLPWIAIAEGRRYILLGSLAAYCGVCVFFLLRSRLDIHSLIKPVLILMTVTSVCAYFSQLTSNANALPAGWLDSHTRSSAVAVWVANPTFTESQQLREIVTANKNLSAIFFTQRPDSYLQEAETKVTEQPDGTLLSKGKPVLAQYVVTSARTRIVGTTVARQNGFVIFKVRSRVRVAR